MLMLLTIAAMPIGLSLIVHILPGAAGCDSPTAKEQRRIFEQSMRKQQEKYHAATQSNSR